MKKILVASHGKLASGIINSVELFAGKQANIEVLDAYIDDSDYTEVIEKFFEELSNMEQGIIFTDIFGGSVNQKVCEISSRSEKKVIIITGFNLPILLEVILSSEDLSEKTIDEMISNCQVLRVKLDSKNNTDFSDSFFDEIDEGEGE